MTFETGENPARPRARRAYHHPAPIAIIGNRVHVRLTPPCHCGYPLVKWDRSCPRCHDATPWAATAPALFEETA